VAALGAEVALFIGRSAFRADQHRRRRRLQGIGDQFPAIGAMFAGHLRKRTQCLTVRTFVVDVNHLPFGIRTFQGAFPFKKRPKI